jgi:hypothetical protein
LFIPKGGKPLPYQKKVLQAKNEYFCAGAVWERIDGIWRCTEAAPIIKWMLKMNWPGADASGNGYDKTMAMAAEAEASGPVYAVLRTGQGNAWIVPGMPCEEAGVQLAIWAADAGQAGGRTVAEWR